MTKQGNNQNVRNEGTFSHWYYNQCFTSAAKRLGLGAYFGNVVKGSSEVLTTDFAGSVSTEKLLSQWMDYLVSIDRKWPTLLEFEKDLANKVGPLSVRKPLVERMEDIDSYYLPTPSGETISNQAISSVLDEFGKLRGLHPRSNPKTVDGMKLSTNSGSPFFTKRRKVVEDTVPCAVSSDVDPLFGPRVVNNDYQVWQILDGHKYAACAVLGWRGQEGGLEDSDVKQRVVWMFPFAVNIEELSVYQPLIETAQTFDLVPAWVSMESVDRRITNLFDTKDPSDLIVCTDFSKFDQHFNEYLQKAAYSILFYLLDNSLSSHRWLEDVFPIKYCIPLAYNRGMIRFGKHGMASGSGGTNCDETLVHRALQYEAAQRQGKILNPNSQCLGDDGLLSYPGITVEDVLQSYTSHGLEMNADKQYASRDDCTYLRRWHHKDYREDGVCVGVYSTCRALGRLRYLERSMDVAGSKKEEALALRSLSILENVKYHPLREEFVDFCVKRDPLGLGTEIPGFLANIVSEATEIVRNTPSVIGYNAEQQLLAGEGISGIREWWIYKYLVEHYS